MEFDLFIRYGPALLNGFGVTVLCWIAGTVLGSILGFALALGMRTNIRVLTGVIRVYIEVIRGTPFLVQLFILYYGGPSFGLVLDPIPAGVIGLTIYGSPYFAEIFRAGFGAVPPGQVEAAQMLGLSRLTILRRVMLPQMLISIIPSLTNFSIILTKETAILSVITVPELLFEVTTMSTETFAFFEATLALAIFYWGLVELTSYLGRVAEARFTRHLSVRREKTT
ncbi:MAG: amino acid ABC transporter permease [Pseudomonadota bacterium]